MIWTEDSRVVIDGEPVAVRFTAGGVLVLIACLAIFCGLTGSLLVLALVKWFL